MEAKQLRTQPLSQCEKCGGTAETTGGVAMRGKWICAKCWVKYINSK